MPDTDWYVTPLYRRATDLGVSLIAANYSRYVVDLNRSSQSSPLYDNAVTTPVCPLYTFAGEAIYTDSSPTDAEVQARIQEYWQPYHQAIRRELVRMTERFGYALLWDAHSIASEVPALFAGVLLELNFGTRDDASCRRPIAERLCDAVVSHGRYAAVVTGRFKGGHITQRYGAATQRRSPFNWNWRSASISMREPRRRGRRLAHRPRRSSSASCSKSP